jgi:putative transposase
MARRKRPVETLPTIWNCPDELWQIVHAVILELDPPIPGHRGRKDPRPILDGIIYRLRTGCQWNHLPKQFGDDSTVHRTMQRWIERGILDRVWTLLVEHCDELAGVDWTWQSIDCATGKARHGGILSEPIPPIAAKAA